MKRNTAIFVLFFLLGITYFYKAFLSDMLPLGYDIFGYFYPVQSVVKEQYLSGTFPFWNSYMFAGFPLMASSQHAVFYPISILPLLVLPHHLAYNLDVVIHYALAAFFTFLYSRKIGIGLFASIVAGALFAFMGYLTPHLQHLSILRTGIWLPLILYFFEDIRITGSLRSTVLASAAIALQIFAGHPQICFYTYILLLLFVIYNVLSLPRVKRLNFLKLTVTVFCLGLVIASPQLYASFELSSLSARPHLDYGMFSSFAFPFSQLSAFLFPFLSESKPEGYVGQLFVVLAMAAFITGWKNSVQIRFWGGIALFSLALALGDAIHPLNAILFHVPVYNSFRGASKHILEFSLSIAILAGFGISIILEGDNARKCLSLVSILLFCCLLIPLILAGFLGIGEMVDPRVISSILTTAVCLATIVFIWKSGRHSLFKYLVIGVALLEIISFRSVKWIRADNVDRYSADLFQHISTNEGRAVFFGPVVPMLAMQHRISMLDGYDPLIPQDYNVFFQLAGIGYWPPAWPQLVENNMILSMLNTRYLVLPRERAIPESVAQYKMIFDNDKCLIYENRLVMPRAYAVTDLRPTEGLDQIRTAIMTNQIDAKSQAIVSPKDFGEIGSGTFAEGTVSMLEYTYDKVSLRTDFKGKGFVVLSDEYYPGWNAFVDGKLTKIYKTNGIVRGVVVPAGVHHLTFRYRPIIIYSLMLLSALVSAGIAVSLCWLKENNVVFTR